MFFKLKHKILCALGFHVWGMRQVASLGKGSHWFMCGQACRICNAYRVSEADVIVLAKSAFYFGKLEATIEFTDSRNRK